MVKSGPIRSDGVAKKAIHYLDFDTLLMVNKAVVQLTKEPHEFTPADGEKLKELLVEVEERANGEKLEDALSEKAALLVFKIAYGQHFRGGNKRTALLAGYIFLRKNGHKIDITDSSFVSAVDKVGIAAATLDDLYGVMQGLVKKSTADRRSWAKTIEDAVESNRTFLTNTAA